MNGELHCGDCRDVLQKHIATGSVDLVYLDPPFHSGRDHEALRPEAGDAHFSDRWVFDDAAEAKLAQAATAGVPEALLLATMRTTLFARQSRPSLLAYLLYIAERVREVHRVLKPSGSMYLHCDGSASHALKVVLDCIFGPECFLNNVVWLYGLGGSSARRWPKKHDDLLFYARTPNGHYFEADRIAASSQRMAGRDKKALDWWDIPSLNNMSKERVGYPTQKPLALLQRVVRSSSQPGDVVLDPFCGSGTTLVAAQALDRRWIGIDRSPAAIDCARQRLAVAAAP